MLEVMRKLVKGEFDTWMLFCDAVKKVSVDKIDSALTEENHLHSIEDDVAVLPLVSATSDSIVIPLDRYLFPHLFLTLYHIYTAALPFEILSAPSQRTYDLCGLWLSATVPNLDLFWSHHIYNLYVMICICPGTIFQCEFNGGVYFHTRLTNFGNFLI